MTVLSLSLPTEIFEPPIPLHRFEIVFFQLRKFDATFLLVGHSRPHRHEVIVKCLAEPSSFAVALTVA